MGGAMGAADPDGEKVDTFRGQDWARWKRWAVSI
jgi:hypothetical protein